MIRYCRFLIRRTRLWRRAPMHIPVLWSRLRLFHVMITISSVPDLWNMMSVCLSTWLPLKAQNVPTLCKKSSYPRSMTYTYRRCFFSTPLPITLHFLIDAKETLKSVQSSDLGPNFSCWEARPVVAWSANINKLQ